MARSKLKPCARRRTRISKRNRRADLGCKRAGVSLEMREESVTMHRQGGLSSTEIVNVWQTRGVNIPSRTVRYWCSKLVQRPVGNPSVTTPEKFQARLDHSVISQEIRPLRRFRKRPSINVERRNLLRKAVIVSAGSNSVKSNLFLAGLLGATQEMLNLVKCRLEPELPNATNMGDHSEILWLNFCSMTLWYTFIAFLTKNGVYTPLTIKVWTRCPLDLMVMSARFVRAHQNPAKQDNLL